MRKTHASVQVAIALAAAPGARHWGYDLVKRSGVRSGVLYPVLGRMLDAGWLSDGWENREETGSNHPPRRYYRVTEQGRKGLGGLLDQARSDPRFSGLWFRDDAPIR